MEIDLNGRLVVQGGTEAALVAHYLLVTGNEDRLEWFNPPIEERTLGLGAFVLSRINNLFSKGSNDSHVIEDPTLAYQAIRTLRVSVNADSSQKPPKFGRRAHFLHILSEKTTATTIN